MAKNNDKEVCAQIFEYYLLHKNFECIFNCGFNPLFKDIKKSIFNPYNEIFEEDLYIIDIDWIDYWKIYSNYEKIKSSYFDSINIFDANTKIENELKEMCKNLVLLKEINTGEKENVPSMNNRIAGNKFCNKLVLNLKDLNCLVRQNNFISFSRLSGEKFENRTNTRNIKALIIDKIIFLIFEEELKVKFIYEGKNGIVQLTADFAPNEFNEIENKKPLKTKLFNFKQKEIRRKRADYWLNFFDSNNIENVPEVQIINDFGQIDYILRNDKLCLNEMHEESLKLPNFNFNNVRIERFIGLTNIGATCYMNSTLQCFINNKFLTEYLLNKSVFSSIINNKDKCELTCCYCLLLAQVCCNLNIKSSYKPEQFKKIISIKNPLFKGIQANDSKDLINFMLEEMNSELNQLENKNDNCQINKIYLQKIQKNKELMLNAFIMEYTKNNKSIIPRIFYFINEIQTECLNCHQIKYNYQVSFIFDFLLKSTYEYCLKCNIPSMSKGEICISLLNCFEYYIQPNLFEKENKLYCNSCNTEANGKYTNLIYSLSPTIIISLNRGKNNVFSCKVDFPEFLDLQKYVLCPHSNKQYELKGVITHLGPSGMAGHFIAYCKHRISNKWYCYNDSVVSLCSDQRNDFKKGVPYILFYESINGNNNILYDRNNNNINKFNSSNQVNNFNQNINMNNMNYIHNKYNVNNMNFMNNLVIINYFNDLNMMNNINIMSNINNMNYINNMNNMNNMSNMSNINNMSNMNNMNNINNTNNMNNMNNMNIMNNI